MHPTTLYRTTLAGIRLAVSVLGLAFLGACAATEPAAIAAPEPPEDINARFVDPEADPQQWVERFERESREIFVHRDEIAAAVGLEPGDRVADVGAGTGLFVPIFAGAVGETGKVYAVDISPNLVAYMKERVADAGLPNVEVVLSGETSTKLAEGSVNAVFTCDTYHHFTFPREMLASIRAALVDGGRLVVVDFEREPGKTREWLLDHVRAGKAQVIEEIEAAGFDLLEEVEVPGMVENYVLRFVKR